MSDTQRHQPIGFVCCHCKYRSSGSYCSNPDSPDCPHRSRPRCRECPILFTPSRSTQSNGRTGGTTGTAGGVECPILSTPSRSIDSQSSGGCREAVEAGGVGQGTPLAQERNHSIDSRTSSGSSGDSRRSSGEQ
ncbi:hypothetical protein F5Y06DRAFT_269667 [Hypoxylon sp. FL0890]|nr:hypothetical protein F5Y06DRAFT_269667 [Hypoxylon sp. FL0890]